MKIAIGLLLAAWSVLAVADLSPVRVVKDDAQVSACSFVGQITRTNGLFQTKSANKILQAAFQEAADAGADTVIVRQSAHSGVLLDAYKCNAIPAATKP